MTSAQTSLKDTVIFLLGRITSRLKTCLVLLLLMEMVINSFNTITCYDFPWQLAEGQFILHHGYPPHSVLQSFGEISPTFANEYILYEIIIAAINAVGGWLGLCLFFAGLSFLIHAPCLKAFLTFSQRVPLSVIIFFLLAQYLISDRLAVRPELIADVCFITVGIMLLQADRQAWTLRRLVMFGAIFCLWSNVHGSFLVGLVMVGLWYGQCILFNGKSLITERDFQWLLPGMAAFAGCLLNPFGVYRFIQPFQVHGLLWGQGESLEMWPVTLDWSWLPLICTAGGLYFLVTRFRRQRTYWLMALLLGVLYLTFTSNRYMVLIGLTLLVILWNEAQNSSEYKPPGIFPLFFSMGRTALHGIVTVVVILYVAALLMIRVISPDCSNRYFYPNTLLSISSSFSWLRQQPNPNYTLLSMVDSCSWAQMPGYSGIHPYFDSGTHRYSDRTNELFYYLFFDPRTLALISSDLQVNAIIIDGYTMAWATVLNGNPNWKLAFIGADSQIYLRADNLSLSDQQKMFVQWEDNSRYEFARKTNKSPDSPTIIDKSAYAILRGARLRPDRESLRLLARTGDSSWVCEPQILYLQYWLADIPDQLIRDAIEQIPDKNDNITTGLRVLFALRLKQYDQAKKLVEDWHLSPFDKRYQPFQELRAEAFLRAGDSASARKILDAFWPQPRYSLRWAQLCEQAYASEPRLEPHNAALLTSLEKEDGWKKDFIHLLNRNIANLTGLKSPQP